MSIKYYQLTTWTIDNLDTRHVCLASCLTACPLQNSTPRRCQQQGARQTFALPFPTRLTGLRKLSTGIRSPYVPRPSVCIRLSAVRTAASPPPPTPRRTPSGRPRSPRKDGAVRPAQTGFPIRCRYCLDNSLVYSQQHIRLHCAVHLDIIRRSIDTAYWPYRVRGTNGRRGRLHDRPAALCCHLSPAASPVRRFLSAPADLADASYNTVTRTDP
jgi:hypothetical protein